MKWVVKECPQCGNKMVLVTANLFFRPKALFNLHCERCKNILEYGSEKFTTDAKSLHTDEFVDLLSLLVNSK